MHPVAFVALFLLCHSAVAVETPSPPKISPKTTLPQPALLPKISPETVAEIKKAVTQLAHGDIPDPLPLGTIVSTVTGVSSQNEVKIFEQQQLPHPPIKKVDSQLLNKKKIIADYQILSYCPRHDTTKDQNPIWSELNYIEIHSPIAQHIVTIDNLRKRIVMVFRGSMNTAVRANLFMMALKPAPEWSEYANELFTKNGLLPGQNKQDLMPKVHWGCFVGYLSVRSALLERLNSLAQKYPDYTITSTGYSYGAPLCFYAGVDAKIMVQRNKYKNKVEIMTFGSPRVGDINTASMAFHMFGEGENVRVVNQHDTYPHIPPESIGFRHASQELWNTPDFTTDKNPLHLPPNTWIECSTQFGEDPFCSSSLMDPSLGGNGMTSEANHHEYWTYMTCAKGEDFYYGVTNPDGSAPSGFDPDNGGNIIGGNEEVMKVELQVWTDMLKVLGEEYVEKVLKLHHEMAPRMLAKQ